MKMAKARKITALFSDGSMLTRKTTMPLTYAWRVKVKVPWSFVDGRLMEDIPHEFVKCGFSKSATHAYRASESVAHKKGGQIIVHREIMEVIQG
jgi:hypothetical protein